MNDGQDQDYRRLMERGATWHQAMDYCDKHRLGWSTAKELVAYLNSQITEFAEPTAAEISAAFREALVNIRLHGAGGYVYPAQGYETAGQS